MQEAIDRDDLTGAAIALDSVKIITGDVMQDYFGRYNPHDKKDFPYILYDFDRSRAYLNAVLLLVREIEKTFEELGITA